MLQATPYAKLNQWEPDDKPKRVQFNQDNANIDSALSKINTQFATKNHASTTTDYGIATAANYGHVKAGTSNPVMDGTASVGTANGLYSNANHVHPVDTSRISTSAITNNLTTTAANLVLDARQGKILQDSTFNSTPISVAVTVNPTTLTVGKQYYSEGTMSKSNGYPFDYGFAHVTMLIYGTVNGDSGYKVIILITSGNEIYVKTQSWSSWSNWIKISAA